MILDEEALYDLDMEDWLKMPPLVTDPEPTPAPAPNKRWQALIESVQQYNARIQAPIEVDGERYLGVSDAAKLTGFSTGWFRYSAKNGDLTSRGIRFVIKPRFPDDPRAPIYMAEADLCKLTRRPKGRPRRKE